MQGSSNAQQERDNGRKKLFRVPNIYQRILDEFRKRPGVWFDFEEVNTWALISGLNSVTKSRGLIKLAQNGYLERKAKSKDISSRHPYVYRFRKENIRDASYYLRLPYSRVFVPEESGGFSTRILEFPGCYSEGETLEESYKNLEEAARSWLEACIAQGTAIPPPGIPCFPYTHDSLRRRV